MATIQNTIKKLIKMGKQVEFTAQVKEIGDTGEYFLPDTEMDKIISAHPDYIRAGTTDFKFKGIKGKVWLPYYLTKGFFTTQEDQLLPIKIIPIFN